MRSLPGHQKPCLTIVSTTLLLFLMAVYAAPLPNATEIVSSWEPTPKKRGTLSILISCGAALIVCVWTGVHPNIKPIEISHKESRNASAFLDRLVWALIALLAPDILLVAALHQFLVAKEYQRLVNEQPNQSPRSDAGKGKALIHKMHLKVAFFALMGGFTVESHNASGFRQFTVGFMELDQACMMDRIRAFSVKEIKDKSKASKVAKTIACIQTGWVLLEYLGRQSNGIHISLLELNTAVHVLIAILVYALWWEKPVDIGRPIVVLLRGSEETAYKAHKELVQHALGETSKILVDGEGTPQPTSLPTEKQKAILVSTAENGDNILSHRKKEHAAPTSKPFTTNHTDASNNSSYPKSPSLSTKHTEQAREEAREDALKEARERAVASISRIPPRPELDKLWFCVLVCHLIDTTPARARGYLEATPKAVNAYLHKVVKHDVTRALVTSYLANQKKRRIPPAVSKAAYSAALKEAYRVAFPMAQSELHGTIKNIATGTVQESKAGENLEECLSTAYNVVRKQTFKLSYQAAFDAAGAVLGHLKKQSQESKKGQHETAGEGAKEEENSGEHVLFATLRAANTATRAASRQAIRLAALGESLSQNIAAAATERAFREEVQEIEKLFRDRSIGDIDKDTINKAAIDKDTIDKAAIDKAAIDKAATIMHDYVIDQYYYRYQNSTLRSGLGSEVEATAKFLEWVSFEGISNVVRKLIDDAAEEAPTADGDWKSRCQKVTEKLYELQEFQPDEIKKSRQERLLRSLSAGRRVLAAQLFTVPGLFQKVRGRGFGQPSATKVGESTEAGKSTEAGESTEAGKSTEAGESTEADKSTEAGKSTEASDKKDKFFSQDWRRIHRLILLVVSGMAGAFYGAIHAGRWHSQWFPSQTEQMLWRVSCIVGATSCVPIVLVFTLTFWVGQRSILRKLVVFLFTLTMMLFVAARFYLVLESFMALRNLPPGAFDAVPWAEAIPHL